MESPDEFRRRVRLLVGAALALRHFNRVLSASLNLQKTESPWGWFDGVTLMTQYSQLKEVLPSELAFANISPALFAAKLDQMTLMVYRRTTTAKYVLFLDKSGSMTGALTGPLGALGHDDSKLREFLGTERIAVSKISLAAGLALALYRRFDAEVCRFDTEVEQVSPRR